MTREQRLQEILAGHSGREGALLPILHEVQAEFGCVDREAEAAIARALNLSRAEVHGVASFYHDFSAEADPRPCVDICRAEACQARGVEALVAPAVRAALAAGPPTSNNAEVETTFSLAAGTASTV